MIYTCSGNVPENDTENGTGNRETNWINLWIFGADYYLNRKIEIIKM